MTNIQCPNCKSYIVNNFKAVILDRIDECEVEINRLTKLVEDDSKKLGRDIYELYIERHKATLSLLNEIKKEAEDMKNENIN